ncbi:MAG TPA: hypothetical protein VGL08_06220 [Paraburkholderia sp.]|jgi:hypothetical protein
MPNRTDTSFFSRLIAPMLKQLERIAGGSRGEHSLEDLKSEAWIAAEEIRTEDGVDYEPDDARLQDAILIRLRKAFGHFANRMMRFALQLDHERTGEDGDLLPNSIAARLTGPEAYEPERAIERAQDLESDELVLSQRFSEAVAYLRTFENFDNDREAIAVHLSIPVTSLHTKLRRAERVAIVQPSMFDGIESIARDFIPLRGHSRRASPRKSRFSCVFARCLQLRLLSTFPALLGK